MGDHVSAATLEALEARIKHDLDMVNYPNKQWLKPHKIANGGDAVDVLIIGGGQSAITISHALRKECVVNTLMVDDNDDGKEGPWSTFARMPTLRTPKNQTGPDLGMPSLTYRAWFEAQFGAEEWDKVTYIVATSWHKYLNWLRNLLKLPVRHRTRVDRVTFVDGGDLPSHYEVHVHNVSKPDEKEVLYARKVIAATGIDGCGEWHVPKYIKDAIPKKFYAHTRELIDFEGLQGKRIGILGAGASAFDNASVALETGAADVRLFFRRDSLPNVNVYKWMGFTGFHGHHADLPDDMRWKFMHKVLERGQLPPTDTYNRAMKHPNFTLQPSSPWTGLRLADDGSAVVVTTPNGQYTFDFVVIATGFTTNLKLRPEFADFASDALLWKDVYQPECPELENSDMGMHPYLSRHFQFKSKSANGAVTKKLEGFFCFTFGGFVSHGVSGSSITALRWSVPTVVRGVTASLYCEDVSRHFSDLTDFSMMEY
jgi:cation diffusion facilitator CzcD-associated flavoprotein CzcO